MPVLKLMPALKGEEISRAHPVNVSALPRWLQLQIQRQKDGPWCDACGFSMPQESRDRGELTHPKCDPHDKIEEQN